MIFKRRASLFSLYLTFVKFRLSGTSCISSYTVFWLAVVCVYRLQIRTWLRYHLLFHQNQNRLICLILDKLISRHQTLSQMETLSSRQRLLHPWETNPNQQGSSRGSCWPPASLQVAKQTRPFLQVLNKRVPLLLLSGPSRLSLPRTPSFRPSGNPRPWLPAPYTPCIPSTRFPAKTSSRPCRARWPSPIPEGPTFRAVRFLVSSSPAWMCFHPTPELPSISKQHSDLYLFWLMLLS